MTQAAGTCQAVHQAPPQQAVQQQPGMVAAAHAAPHPLWLAQSKLRRRRYDEAINICTAALQHNPLDQVNSARRCWRG